MGRVRVIFSAAARLTVSSSCESISCETRRHICAIEFSVFRLLPGARSTAIDDTAYSSAQIECGQPPRYTAAIARVLRYRVRPTIRYAVNKLS